jgi:Ca-activated chloride channel family protein
MPLEFILPELLYLLVLLPLWWLAVWPWEGGSLFFVRGGSGGESHGRGWAGGAAFVWTLPRLLRSVAMAFLIVALAHPRTAEVIQETTVVGKGTVIAVDISTSMLADDMDGNRTRLEVAREAAMRFARARDRDELALVAFAGEALVRVPPTPDPRLVVSGIESLEVQLVLDGTDISKAMLSSIAGLADSDRERVIVLLTDGAHNGQGVDPLVTARVAAAFGMRVHSISLMGQPDLQGSPPVVRAALERQARLGSEMETVLTGISRITGGEYFQASSTASLDSIYGMIAAIEAPTEEIVDVTVYRSLRVWLLLGAISLIGLEALVRGSRWGLLS